ncbi:MAG: LysR family transcriptional regulator [Lachnospiraceae bacterium]|nr:LysR family transcriptional regulator [Lachnospiraceae bacterium]
MQVYEERSINRAARQMFITPQGLSKIIRHLEEELEVSLFDRSSNGMVPTESGTYFYENSRLILDKLDEIKIGMRQICDRERKLVMGFSCGVLNVFPLQRLEAYKLGGSQIEVQWEEFSNQEVIDKALKGSIDIGFVIGIVTEHGLWSRELFSRKMNAIVYEGHPFYNRESLSVNDLRGESLITLNEKYYS